jgi:lipopolysaccharide/colanic/teichoic acid biosynthesis glycosyltransferase
MVIVLLLPVFLILTVLLIFVNSGSPFFLQSRPGKDGHLFTLIKFKTMNDKKDKDGNLLPDVIRLNTIGRFIRKFSLDELPQFFCVLKGDMSVIGPRPLLTEYLPLYTKKQARRHEIRPGITGWAQVNGRNAISWEEKFKLDVYYVDNISFQFDMKILILTIWKAIRREGVNSDSSNTMPIFKGSVN